MQKAKSRDSCTRSIYKGLNDISHSPTSGQEDSCFPIHYVYRWLSFYFNTHFANDPQSASHMMVTFSRESGARYYGKVEARRKIFKANGVDWTYTTCQLNKDFTFFYDENANHADHKYFMCIWSNYLILQLANYCIVESYTPHRFGYYQNLTGILADDKLMPH